MASANDNRPIVVTVNLVIEGSCTTSHTGINPELIDSMGGI